MLFSSLCTWDATDVIYGHFVVTIDLYHIRYFMPFTCNFVKLPDQPTYSLSKRRSPTIFFIRLIVIHCLHSPLLSKTDAVSQQVFLTMAGEKTVEQKQSAETYGDLNTES